MDILIKYNKTFFTLVKIWPISANVDTDQPMNADMAIFKQFFLSFFFHYLFPLFPLIFLLGQ